jgi:hypothetical protein
MLFAGTKRVANVVLAQVVPLHHHLDERVSQKLFKRRFEYLAHIFPDHDIEVPKRLVKAASDNQLIERPPSFERSRARAARGHDLSRRDYRDGEPQPDMQPHWSCYGAKSQRQRSNYRPGA